MLEVSATIREFPVSIGAYETEGATRTARARYIGAWLYTPLGSWMAFLAIAIATRLPFLQGTFVNIDEGAHMVGARELLRGGGALYQTFADNKPPLIYVFYALAHCVGESVASVRVFATLTVLPLTALALAWGLRWGARGFLAGSLYLLSTTSMLAADAHAIHCEHLMLLPLSLLLGVSSRNRHGGNRLRMLQGVLVAIAALAKQPAVLFLCVPLLLVLMDRGRMLATRLLEVSCLLLGFGLTLFASYFAFRLAGTADAYLYWVLLYNIHHIANPVAPMDAMVRGGLALLLVTPCVAPMVWALSQSASVRKERVESLLWVLAALIPVGLGLRFFGHYFLPLAWILSWLAAKHIQLTRHAVPTFASVLWCASLFTLVNINIFDPAGGIAEIADPRFARLGEAVRNEHRCFDDASMFVWGYAAPVYVFANTRPASRFVVPIDTISGFVAGETHQARHAAQEGYVTPISDEHWRWLMHDLNEAQPAVVVDTAPSGLNGWESFTMASFPPLATFVREHYVREREVDGSVIYRHRRCYVHDVELSDLHPRTRGTAAAHAATTQDIRTRQAPPRRAPVAPSGRERAFRDEHPTRTSRGATIPIAG